MKRHTRKISWMISALLFLAFMAGCAFREQAAFERRIGKMSDKEVIAAYKGVVEKLKSIDREIRRDKEEIHHRRVVNPAPEMDAYFRSGYVDLHAKEKILIEEIKKRRLHP